MRSTLPLATPEGYSRHNLATGPYADACLRAWAILQCARTCHRTGSISGTDEILSVIQTRVPAWPKPVQTFLFRSLDTIGREPFPREVSQ